MHPDPNERLRLQAHRLRTLWQSMSAEERQRLGETLPTDPLGRAWAAILAGEHPFAVWLDSDQAWPPTHGPGLPTPRQLVTSHPFARRSPWSTPAT